MAIHDNGNNEQPKTQTTQAEPREEKAQRPRRRSIFEINRNFRRSISRSQLGEVVARWRESLEAIIKNPTQNEAPAAHEVLVFNGETNNTPFSALIHVTKSEEGTKYAAYHTLILEGSAEPLQPELKRIQNFEIEVQRTAGDAYDDIMADKIHTLVADQVQGYELRSSGFNVIMSENRPDEDNAKIVAFFSNAANEALLDRLEQVEPFSIQGCFDPDQDNLRARLEYDPESMGNVNDLPVRSDVRVSVTAHSRGQHGATMRLTEVDAYVDLVLDQDAAMNAALPGYGGLPNQFGGPQQQPSTQRYYPRAILTRADNAFNMISLETELLSLVTVALLTKNSMYSGVWRPRKGVKQKDDLRDIGAVNLELGLIPDPKNPQKRTRINTKSDNFTDAEAFQLIRAVVKDELIFSMDVEQGGEHSWVQNLLLLATTEDAQGQQAHQAILQAADALTNGFFRQEFDPSNKIAQHDGNRIQLGYYVDAQGVKRDLREIDHLSMLNMFGETNMEIVDRYADTFDKVDEDMDMRLHVRTGILREAVGDVYIKGYADRINFTPVFMKALISAAFKAGLSIDPSAMHTQFNAAPRGNAHIGRFANQAFTGDVFQSRPQSAFGRGGFMGGGGRW